MLNFLGDTTKLFEAIGKAMNKMRPLPRTSTGKLTASQTFQYAPLRKVVECIKSDLQSEGVSFMQALHTNGDRCALSLIVAGHGGSVTSMFSFPQNSDPKKFGADSTYYRRYQLNSFFGLEGDPDADDFEDSVAPVKEEPVKESPKADDKPKSGVTSIKPSNPNGSGDKQAKAVNAETQQRSVKDALIDAMRQLNWQMNDCDAFCKEHINKFPGYVHPTKLTDVGKATLLALLVEHKGVAPF